MIRRMRKTKLVAMIIVGLMAASSMSVFAQETIAEENTQGIVLDSTEGIDLENQDAESQRLVKLGEIASKKRATKILSNFRNLQQGDATWKNVVMQSKGKTIGSAGCCLTSFTMIQRYYGGSDNPAQVNSKLGSAACLFVYNTAASKYGYTNNYVTNSSILSSPTNYIKGAIDSGNPVLVGMQYSGGTHFVAAYGYDGNNIIISDPAGRNYQYLSQYTNSGYSINRLCTYFK